MATTTSATRDKSTAPAKKPAPPDERFWQRYSPHGELPLSSISSFAVHILVIGLLTIWTVYLVHLIGKPKHSLPVSVVRIGGGGGSPDGESPDPGKGGRLKEDVPPTEDRQTTPTEITPRRPKLSDLQIARLPDPKFKPNDVRQIQQPDAASAVERLKQKSASTRIPDGRAASAGKGGSGSGGGQGSGRGSGEGGNQGPGNGTLSQRERRMLRWTMKFNTTNGVDYVSQLRGLGAILAIPVVEGPPRQYKLVRDLSKRPAQLLDEDLSSIQRIYWIDDKPQSVHDVMNALGLKLRPSHFVAFMPPELEAKLFKMELNYRGLKEDQIEETQFAVKKTSTGYEPEVISQTAKSGK